jgi:pilus assembly protein Flp/PilA
MGLRPQKGAEMLEYVIRRLRREDGQALVEYALILFLIAVVCIGVLTALGEGVSATLQSIVDAITP